MSQNPLGHRPEAASASAASASSGRLSDLQRQLETLEAHAATLQRRNERLTTALNAARDRILELRTHDVDNSQVTGTYAVASGHPVAGLVDVLSGGRRHRVRIDAELGEELAVAPGQEVLLDENMQVVEAFATDVVGEVVALKDVLPDGRAIVVLPSGEERMARVAESVAASGLRGGDSVLYSPRDGFLLERLQSAQVTDVILEEVPDISYADIGGLDRQISEIEDAVELPFVHPELFAEHHLRPPKGVLLYGPPGCGKTLIAKAVAASLTRQAAEQAGLTGQKSYFLNIKGPELLNKYVGETERQIRQIFTRAREKATEGLPVVVFFDEMDSLFRTRGSGVSSDVETTIVPQLLAEIDGVEGLRNVIVIGASNREDMIDPAILRPGRLDVKIRIERPDEAGARDIFSKYLTPELPLHASVLERFGGAEAAVAGLIEETVGRIYQDRPENRFLEVTYADGTTEQLAFRDFTSGAMIRNIVDRAKKLAIKDLLSREERGISAAHLERAVREEFAQNEDLPSTTNPDDWARVSGRRGQRIVSMRALAQAGLAELG